MAERSYRTVAEVAEDLGVSMRTVRRWIAQGRVEFMRVGRILRIPDASYARLLARDESVLGRPRRSVSERTPSYGAATAPSTAAGGAGPGVGPGNARTTAPDAEQDPASRRLRRDRSRAATQMDRLAARGLPPRTEAERADAILRGVRGDLEHRLVDPGGG